MAAGVFPDGCPKWFFETKYTHCVARVMQSAERLLELIPEVRLRKLLIGTTGHYHDLCRVINRNTPCFGTGEWSVRRSKCCHNECPGTKELRCERFELLPVRRNIYFIRHAPRVLPSHSLTSNRSRSALNLVSQNVGRGAVIAHREGQRQGGRPRERLEEELGRRGR